VVEALLLVGYLGLPIMLFLVTRSVTVTAIWLTFTISLTGVGLQALSHYGGIHWSLAQLQAMLLLVLVVMTLLGWWVHGRQNQQRPGSTRTTPRASWRRQVLLTWGPMLVLVLFLIVMRLLAPGGPHLLTGVGYLMEHPVAEDNAKWLNIGSQMASGQEVIVNGYVGGPLALVMVAVVTGASLLSILLVGGVNEVAVAVASVTGSQFALIVMSPLTLAPFVETRLRLRGVGTRQIPLSAIWLALVVLAAANAALTWYGHLSLQFTWLIIVLWAATFLVHPSMRRARLLTTLSVVTVAAVWLPLNVFCLGLLFACLIWAIRRTVLLRRAGQRIDWPALALVIATGAACWDAIVSSTLFSLGLFQCCDDVTASPAGVITTIGGAAVRGAAAVAQVPAAFGLPSLALPRSLDLEIFSQPGGTESITPVLAVLVALSFIGAAALIGRNRGSRTLPGLLLALLPLLTLTSYAMIIATLDVLLTGQPLHYGSLKLSFAVAITILVTCLPLALMHVATRPLRWLTVGILVFVLMTEGLLARAGVAVSPERWPATVGEEKLPYWAPAEVRPVAEQPLSQSPLACVFLPRGAEKPSALPNGQLAYACTRTLVGLSGTEIQAGRVVDWLRTDWLTNSTLWNEYYGDLILTDESARRRPVILLDGENQVIGLDTLDGLLNRYPPVSSPTTN